MPSPLSGFTHAAASPISAQFGPATLDTAPPIGSSAEATDCSGASCHASRCCEAYRASSFFVFTFAGRASVDSAPQPRFTVPSPSGKIQP